MQPRRVRVRGAPGGAGRELMDRDAKSHGLLFTGEMIKALLAGRKSVTRRQVSRHNSTVDGPTGISASHWAELDFSKAWVDKGPSPAGNSGPYLHVPCAGPIFQHDGAVHRAYPRIQPGDEVWARETWAQPGTVARSDDPVRRDGKIVFRADGESGESWRSPIHMPRWASRVVRAVAAVKCERVQDITEADIIAEGVTCDVAARMTGISWSSIPTLRHAWQYGWEHINGLESWKQNPWVWAYSIPVARP